jgi:hypothetical protein
MKSVNDMAKKIAVNEGLKKEISIAQIKEVLRIAAIILHDDYEMMAAFKKYGERKSWEMGRTK